MTCIKSYWVQKAVQDGLAKGTVAWIDLGLIIVAKIFLILKILIFCGIIDFSPKFIFSYTLP